MLGLLQTRLRSCLAVTLRRCKCALQSAVCTGSEWTYRDICSAKLSRQIHRRWDFQAFGGAEIFQWMVLMLNNKAVNGMEWNGMHPSTVASLRDIFLETHIIASHKHLGNT
jgi:hypothetical protein